MTNPTPPPSPQSAKERHTNPVKHWTSDDNAVLEEALKTGYLPDGQIATQQRMAAFLGFSRMTIVNKLCNRQFPLHTMLKSAGAKVSAYNRRQRLMADAAGLSPEDDDAAITACPISLQSFSVTTEAQPEPVSRCPINPKSNAGAHRSTRRR